MSSPPARGWNPLAFLSTDRRRYLRLILPVGALAFAAPLWLHHLQPFLTAPDTTIFTFMLSAFLLLALSAWLPIPVLWLGGALVAQVMLFALWRLANLLFTPHLPDPAGQVAATLPWVIVTQLVTGWVFDHRRSLLLNGAMLGALTVLTVSWWPAPPWLPEQQHLMHALIQLLLASGTLIAAQSAALSRVDRISARARRAVHEAHTDVLTSLPNRRSLQLLLDHHAAQRDGQLLALALLDIDHFKRVNDQYGHATGDKVLRGLAEQFQRRLSRLPGSLIGRYGGEEFLLIMRVPDPDRARHTCEHLCQGLASRTTCGLHVTVSVGLVIGEVPTHVPTLLDAADEALYRAKEAGRNRVHTVQLTGAESQGPSVYTRLG